MGRFGNKNGVEFSRYLNSSYKNYLSTRLDICYYCSYKSTGNLLLIGAIMMIIIWQGSPEANLIVLIGFYLVSILPYRVFPWKQL